MRKTALCLALATGLAAAMSSAASARTDSLPVGTCMNIGNTFESPKEAEWGGRKLADDDLDIIAKAGFDTIRLPVRWDTHADLKPPYKIDADYMARIKHVVGLAQKAGLNVILNSHHFAAMHTDPVGTAPRHAALWAQIARAFANEPNASLWFELENEPHDKFNHGNLLQALSPALAEIRKTNPDRPVIIGGELWSGIDSLATLPLPDDANIVPTFHYYDPFDFTHQGASWVDPSPALGRVYGNADDKAKLVRDVQKIKDYVARTGKTPFMGETGAHTTISLEQRVQYHKAVNEAFRPIGVGMCMWAYNNTFQFYDKDKKQWQPGLLEAIGLPKQK